MKTNTPTLMEVKELNKEMWLFGSESYLKRLLPDGILKISGSGFLSHGTGGGAKISPPLPVWSSEMLTNRISTLLLFKQKRWLFPLLCINFIYYAILHSNASCCRPVCPIQGVGPRLQRDSPHSENAGRWTPGLVCQGSTEPQKIVPVNAVTILGAEHTPETSTLQSSIDYISLSIREIKSSEK